MPFFKYTLLGILLIAVCPFLSSAQVNCLRPLMQSTAKPSAFTQALRAGGRAYIVPNMRLGQEALEAGMRSCVGAVAPTLKEQLKCQAYQVCVAHFSPGKVNALVERALIKEPFPGYYFDFAKEWESFHRKTQVGLGRLEVILEAAYGEEVEMEGAFVPSYKQVLQALHQEKEGFTAREALKQAYSQALQKKTGFFILVVHKTPESGQDVLLLDLKNKQFLSLGQSVGAAWAAKQLPIE